MKIALCYSGMFRDFLDCVNNHKIHLIDHYDCDVYLNLWDVYGFGWVSKKYNHSDNDTIEPNDIVKILKILNPKDYFFESFKEKEPELSELSDSISTHNFQPYTKNVLCMYYKIKKCGDMIKTSNINYNVIVRMRTDILFREKIDLFHNMDDDTVYVNKNFSWNENTVSDLFGYGKLNTMSYYFDMYDHLKFLWGKHGPLQSPELILYSHLTSGNININRRDILLDISKRG